MHIVIYERTESHDEDDDDGDDDDIPSKVLLMIDEVAIIMQTFVYLVIKHSNI